MFVLRSHKNFGSELYTAVIPQVVVRANAIILQHDDRLVFEIHAPLAHFEHGLSWQHGLSRRMLRDFFGRRL